MSSLHKSLVKILKKRTPEKETTVNLLTEMLPISREAAYRRIRGEIPFTLEEATTICKAMNISIDLLMGIKQNNIHVFHLNAIFKKDPIKVYSKMLSNIVEGVRDIIQVDDAECIALRAYRTLPLEFIYKYKYLSRTYLYVLLHQLHYQYTPKELLEIPIPDTLFSLQQEAHDLMQEIDTEIILDKKVFVDYMEIVKYFEKVGLFEEDTVMRIKDELHQLINDLEKVATEGVSVRGKKIDIYICSISFDCSYIYFKGGTLESIAMGVYCIDYLTCQRPSLSEIQKLWIKSLVRFSTLISVSGEYERNEFFRTQRDYVDTML